MNMAMPTMNSKGFTSQLSRGRLPDADHITYEGVFNQLTFQIGKKSDKLLDAHIGYCRVGNKLSFADNRVHEFIALFIKSKVDGEPRDSRRLNSVIVLDISGSMSGGLRGSSAGQSRLQLSKEAIKMFVSKLKPNDSFGLVIFDDKGQTVIPCTLKKDLQLEAVFAMVDQIKTRGGTTLSSGFNEGLRNLKQYLSNSAKNEQGQENRIVMLTDVGDNSLQTQKEFMEKVSSQQIHVTIVGISDQFRSSTCQKLTMVRGFNYFCAVEHSDLKKYLFQNFDWTFFPSLYNMNVQLETQDIKFFKVYGTADSSKVNQYNNFAVKGNGKYTITKTQTCFPSELQTKNGVIHMHGGLILLELGSQPNLKSIKGNLNMTGYNVKGQAEKFSIPLDLQLPEGEQFFSEKSLEQAISGFYFVKQMKQLITRMKSTMESKIKEEDRQKAIASLTELKKLAPESKQKEVDDMIKLVKDIRRE